MTGLLSPEMIALGAPRIEQLQAVAARKGVTLDIQPLRHSTLTPTVEQIASEIGCGIGQVVSASIYVAPLSRGLLKPIMCLTAGRGAIDLELLAAVIGEVEVRVATAREAHDLLNCSPGMVPAFGYRRDVLVVMDRDLGGYQWVWAPTGLASAVFRISPSTLRMLSNATVALVTTASTVASLPSFDSSSVLRFGAA